MALAAVDPVGILGSDWGGGSGWGCTWPME